eukprot:867005-Pyramimonas_sp.AAC.2
MTHLREAVDLGGEAEVCVQRSLRAAGGATSVDDERARLVCHIHLLRAHVALAAPCACRQD